MRRPTRWSAVLCLGLLGLGATSARAEVPGSERQKAELRALEARAGQPLGVRWDARRGVAKFLSGKLSGASVAPAEEQAGRVLGEAAALLGIGDPSRELRPSGTRQNGLGTFVSFQQLYQGLEVVGGKVTVRVVDGRAVTVANYLEPALALEARPGVAQAAAERKASQVVGSNVLPEATTLVVLPWEGKARLAYRIDFPLRAGPPPTRFRVYVDAQSGAEILVDDRVRHDGPAVGTGPGVDGTVKSFDTYQVGSKFYLGNYPVAGKNVTVKTYTAGGTETLPGRIVSDADDVWSDPAAVDAHYNVNYTIDFLRANFTDFSWYPASGFARAGGIISTVHYGTAYDNAYWDGRQLVFGDGGTTFRALSAGLDVVAHEMTHAITEAISDLVYCKEPGALNESWSDVIGMFVSFAAEDDLPYQIGEEVMKIDETPGYQAYYALRRMDDPPFRTDAFASNDYDPAQPLDSWGQPGHTSEQYRAAVCLPTTDNGGVHINSGIPNKAAYLITQALGVAKAQQIYYLAMFYLTSTSQFVDARDAVEQATTDLYPGDLAAVQGAFTAVGIN